jgi:chaperonin GroES
MNRKRDVEVIPTEKYNFIGNDDVVRRLNEQIPAEMDEAGEHGIGCIEYKVLVRPIKADEKSKGGILLPDQTIEKDQNAAMEGTICGLSPFAFTYEEWPLGARKPRVGDRVVFARYSGINQRGADGVDYRIMNDKDIVAVRRPS